MIGDRVDRPLLRTYTQNMDTIIYLAVSTAELNLILAACKHYQSSMTPDDWRRSELCVITEYLDIRAVNYEDQD